MYVRRMAAPLPGWAGLYAILDLPHAHGLDPLAAARALLGDGTTYGPKILQLRAKRASTAERVALVAQLGPVVRAAGGRLVVDDDVEAALAGPADGVHLGQEDMVALAGQVAWADALAELRARAGAPGFLVGLSTHDLVQVERAAGLALDYIGFGPILPTRSKIDPDPCVGLDGLRAACEISSHPVVAIGGLDAAAALQCVGAGAAAAALIGALARGTETEVRQVASALAADLAAAVDRERGRRAGA